MSDEIEDLLRQFRPVGPPPLLQQRLLVSRIVRWMPAAAAILLGALFYFLASTEHVRLEGRLPHVNPEDVMSFDEAPQ